MELLDPVEARVLGSLMEKEVTTPEYYPLSLNALVSACNQKSNRDPVVNYDEDTVGDAAARFLRVGRHCRQRHGKSRHEKYSRKRARTGRRFH